MPEILNTVIQATALSALSNVLAQLITAYQEKTSYANINVQEILIFVAFTILNTPLNCYWQAWLEDTFPTSKVSTQSENDKLSPKPKINIKNTVVKFALDQTLGATFNTILFIAGIGALKGMGISRIIGSIKRDSWTLYLAGAKLWPAVSVISFTLIPAEKRVIFGSLVGLLWGIYLSLMVR